MDVKGNVGRLTRAIADSEIQSLLDEATGVFRQQAAELIEQFAGDPPTAQKTDDLENNLHEQLRWLGRRLIQAIFSLLQPEPEEMPATVSFRGDSHRRLQGTTTRRDILTRFGKVSLTRARYRRGRRGRTIFPLEMLLGIEDGCTPAAASRVGQQFAACGSSQGRTLEMIADQMGTKIGTEKLRRIVATLAGGMQPHGQQARVDKLMELIEKARQDGKKPVLSVSRDGVALGLAPWSFFEMTSVACISVIAGGKKLGTVYLGRVPETNQVTLSGELTDLLKATVRRCGDRIPEVVYVSDAGKVETAYWRNTLSKFFVDGRRIKITRVVDYYHAAERLTTIADALKFGKDKAKRKEWPRACPVVAAAAGWSRTDAPQHRGDAKGLRLQAVGLRRCRESGAVSSSLSSVHGLRGDEGTWLSDRQRRSGVGMQTDRERTDEVVRDALEEGGWSAYDDAAMPAAQPGLGGGL